MPDSSAPSFICLRAMPICTRDAATLSATVASMIASDGQTSAGAKLNICVTYRSDIRLLRPTDRMLFSSIPHSELTEFARLESSPEENRRKKLTGRESIRIITEASTAWEVLVLMRSIKRLRTRPIS